MAIFHPYKLACKCGHAIQTELAVGINVGRAPALRQKILDSDFHKVKCDRCNKHFTVEKEFFYVDFTRNTFIRVSPSSKNHKYKDYSKELHELTDKHIPVNLLPQISNKRHLRVVFGLDELREKVLAQEANLDDRMVEFLKVLVVYEHPFLLQKRRLRLTLDQIREDKLEFQASYEHSEKQYQVNMPRWIVENALQNQETIKKWFAETHKKDNIFEEKQDYWINMRRWSPQPLALNLLQEFADQVRSGKDVKFYSKQFKQMLRFIPRGSHLPPWAKQDLRVLFEFAKAKGKGDVEDKLFEIRFGFALEDDWFKNDDPDDIDTLWNLLRALPDTNVEGNTEISKILYDEKKGGGWYYGPSGQIGIGEKELGDRESFDSVVRHEVGHAVHERNNDLVNGWLKSQFGWEMFSTKSAEIDKWIRRMGGWGADLSDTEKSQIRSYLVSAVGPGLEWNQTPYPHVPAKHKWWKKEFGPRLAYERSKSNWFEKFDKWYRYDGKAFFLNYYYGTFCIVNENALELIAKMPSNYASMSPLEFFAELYALYFDLDDKRRSEIPAEVLDWLETKIGKPEDLAPFSPLPTPPTAVAAWDWITKPDAATALV